MVISNLYRVAVDAIKVLSNCVKNVHTFTTNYNALR